MEQPSRRVGHRERDASTIERKVDEEIVFDGHATIVAPGEPGRAEGRQVLGPATRTTTPGLIARYGIGTDTATTLLVTDGDNPDRLRSEASFAHLCGSAPIDASSG